MGEHSALGPAGRAGGVQDRREIVGMAHNGRTGRLRPFGGFRKRSRTVAQRQDGADACLAGDRFGRLAVRLPAHEDGRLGVLRGKKAISGAV